MNIIHIKKTGRNQYQIELSEKKIKTYDTIILKYQLLLKKDISEDLLEKIEEETIQAEIYEKTLEFINRKRRTKREVETFLKKQGCLEIEEMIHLLEKNGQFETSSYIEAYIHDKMNFSTDGPNKIKEYLIKEGFDDCEVKGYINQIDLEEIKQKLTKLIEKKIRMNHKYSENYCKQKITEQMILLGYPKDMIQEILEKSNVNHQPILKEEAEKLYQKYCHKKENKELIFYIKQKLYQKGYPIEDIQIVLEEMEK